MKTVVNLNVCIVCVISLVFGYIFGCITTQEKSFNNGYSACLEEMVVTSEGVEENENNFELDLFHLRLPKKEKK